MGSRRLSSNLKSEIADHILWFIGAPLQITKHENGQFRKGQLPKKKEYQASSSEILSFVYNLKYMPPFKRPNKRTVYNILEDFEKEDYVRVINHVRRRGRPVNIFELTKKGSEDWNPIDKKFEAHAKLKRPSDILFSLDPKGQWMTAHVMIKDPEIIRIIKRELARLNKERGRPRDDLVFRGHPAFKYVGAMVFNFIMVLLKMPEQKVSPETKASMMQIMNSLPAVFRRSC